MQLENPQQGLVTVKEAAGFLGLSVAKVYLLMTAGELSYVKLGKSRRIAWQALQELVQRCTHNAPTSQPSRN